MGTEKAQWLDRVALRDGSRERNWEIRSVNPAERSFVVVAHPGNVPQPPRTKKLAELADEEIVRLAALSNDPKDKDDLALRALHALTTLPEPPALLAATMPARKPMWIRLRYSPPAMVPPIIAAAMLSRKLDMTNTSNSRHRPPFQSSGR